MTRDLNSNIVLFNSNPTTPSYSYHEKNSPPYLFEDDNTPLDTNREFLLFPTYAKRNPSGMFSLQLNYTYIHAIITKYN